jgi:RNA polymerase nonessential primary-like sigma factor
MSNAQLAFPISAETVPQSPPGETANETSVQIEELLDAFEGESSLKHLFWELLSYDRVRDPLPLTLLPASAIQYMKRLEVFAESKACSIVLAEVLFFPDGGRLEQMIWAVRRQIGNCIVLLTDSSTWQIIWPDETLKPRVRCLPLPGASFQRAEVVQALCGLNAADEASGEEYTAFEMAETLEGVFPGPTPNIGDLLNDFERIAQHPSPEMRELWFFIRIAGQYPLLTAAQERGEDLTGNEIVPDGTGLPYQQWRLVVHNLRLVVWIASTVPRIGMDLSDLVDEGCIGLMTAARRFDPARGNRFSTMAYWWVRQNILRELHNKCNVIRWPVHRAEKLLPALIQGKETGLTAGEKPVMQFRTPLLRRLWRLSLHGDDPITSLVRQQARSAVHESLAQLKPQQREVIQRRFGISDGVPETLENIGQDLGLTRQRIQQVEARAFEKLRGSLSFQLSPHRYAFEWRQTCARNDASAQSQAPFRDFMQGLYNFISQN